MTQVTAKSKKKTTPQVPPTVLTLTLHPDGSGTLLVQRDDLATLRHFVYQDLRDIMTAIQQGAEHLIAVERNPPPKEFTAAPVSQAAVLTPEASDDHEEDESGDDLNDESVEAVTDTADEDEPTPDIPLMAEEPLSAAPVPGTATAQPDQMSLF